MQKTVGILCLKGLYTKLYHGPESSGIKFYLEVGRNINTRWIVVKKFDLVDEIVR